MDSFGWIISAFTTIIGLAGGACACIVPLLILAGVGYFIYKRSQQSTAYRQTAQNWPNTMGTVMMSSVQEDHSSSGYSTYPVIVYQYTVNGKSYQSQNIKAGDQIMRVRVSGEAQQIVARYPIGATVPVYYNPTNPQESALER